MRKRLTLMDAIYTLSQEPCELVNGQLCAKSDGRVVYRRGEMLVEDNLINPDGSLTAFLQHRIALGCLNLYRG